MSAQKLVKVGIRKNEIYKIIPGNLINPNGKTSINWVVTMSAQQLVKVGVRKSWDNIHFFSPILFSSQLLFLAFNFFIACIVFSFFHTQSLFTTYMY